MKNLQCREDIDIKTIPPNNVCENDRLEIRFQVRNLSNQKHNIKVKLYWDDVVDECLIDTQIIIAEANKFGFGNYFCDTHGHCGKHQIKLVLQSNDEQLILNENIKILPYRENILEGGFLMIGPPNDRFSCNAFRDDVKSLTDKQWQERVDSFNEIGLKTLIITASCQPITVASGELQAHYPSKLRPKTYDLAADDPIKAILSAAEKNGQQVFIGFGHCQDVEPLDELISELYDYYKDFKSFYGWYASKEAAQSWCYWEPMGNYWKKIKDVVSQICPVMPILASPSPGRSTSFSYNLDQQNFKGIHPEMGNFLLANPDCINIMMPQDGVGARFTLDGKSQRFLHSAEDSERRFAVLKEICDQTSIHLWANCESFDSGKVKDSESWTLFPRYVDGGMSGFMRQVMAVRPYVERVLTFCLTGFWEKPGLQPQVGGELAAKQYRDYCKYINNNKDVYRNIALNKPYTASPPQGSVAKEAMPDNKQKITDGKLSGGYCFPIIEDRLVPYYARDIPNQQDGDEIFFDVDITIDLCKRTSIDAVRCAKPVCFNSACPDIITVSVGDDDKSFQTAGTINSYKYGWAEIFFKKSLYGRFVRVNFYRKVPDELDHWVYGWLLLDEIQVCQKVNK
jgi:hypothetical protein